MEKKRFEFPKVVNTYLELDLIRRAKLQVRRFSNEVRPTLSRFQIDDDEHLRKYLASESWEVIYNDVLKERGEFLSWASAEAEYRHEDFWRPFRASVCDKNLKPTDEGFIFAEIPNCWGTCRSSILASIVVADGQITIDETPLHEAAIMRPSERARELYDIVANFCEEISDKKYNKRTVQELFCNYNGKIVPNPRGIMGLWF